MNERGYGRRLAQDLARWRQQGWVSAAGTEAILADLAARRPRALWASSLALIGALLFGLGVVSWFAAHWDEMGKLAKLALIAATLAACHVGHGLCQSRFDLPKLAQALVFLSVLLFGAAIMLIGQIYHIDAHFPDGIALWAAGGLATAWLLASQPALLASLALAAIWTATEQLHFQAMNWPLLGYLLLAGLLLARRDWRHAARGWGLVCILWVLGWHFLPWNGDPFGDAASHVRLFAVQVLGFAGVWTLAQASPHPFARALRADFLLAALAGAFAFTYPRLGWHLPDAPVDPLPWLAALAGVGLVCAAGVARLLRASELPASRRALGSALAACFGLLLAAEALLPRADSVRALLWNGLFLGLMYWIGDRGIRHGERSLINLAFAGFSLWVLARYFDTFWSLLDRSLFFMAGGALLLAGGGWLEHRRRALLRGLDGGAA